MFTWVRERLTNKHVVNPEPPVAPTGEIPAVSNRMDDFAAALGVKSGRTARYDDFEQMDHGDVAALLDAVCDAALTFDEPAAHNSELDRPKGFKIVSKNRNHRKVIEEILRGSALKSKIWMYARDGVKYGDLFIEPLVDASGIVGLQSYSARTMDVVTDVHNRLLTGTDRDTGMPLPYQQRNAQNAVVAGWAPWEMIHWRYMPNDRFAFSVKSLLDDLRPDWKKLSALENSMVVARVVRAYTRNVHYYDTTGLSQVDGEKAFRNYVNRVNFSRRRQAEATAAPDEELFLTTSYINDEKKGLIPRLNKVETIDPAANGLARIADVEYARRKMFSRVPPEILGIPSNNQKDVTAQDIAFGRLVSFVQERLEELVRDVVDLGLLLRGYDLGTVPYEVLWPKNVVGMNWKLADAQFRMAMSFRQWCEMGISRRWAFKRAWGLSDEQIDAILKEFEDEQEKYGPIDPGTAAAKAVAGNRSTESASKFDVVDEDDDPE